MTDQTATAAYHIPFLVPRMRAALEKIYAPRRPDKIFPRFHKRDMYEIMVDLIGKDSAITYLEFGVYKGDSLNYIASKFHNPDARLYGFDSFEGLPEAWGPMPAGNFALDELPVPHDRRRSTFVKGYFQNTVPQFLAANRPSGTVLVHFDADLYSSTLFLLTTLWHHITEYYFMFDEFVADEVVALHDFASGYPIEVEFFGAVEHEDAPLQTLGRLRNTTFVVNR